MRIDHITLNAPKKRQSETHRSELPTATLDIEELHRRWMKAAIGQTEIERMLDDVRKGHVYPLKRIAKMLHCSNNTAWRLFRNQPGVIRLNRVYRVPETVFQRVVSEIMESGEQGQPATKEDSVPEKFSSRRETS
ncbi:MAG: hypothetical protein JST11_23280 [Acidobacteria bacterium]|nr:hypothetical protein [Acidobacteriota bacterium]